MPTILKFIKFASIFIAISLTIIAIYGRIYGWAGTIVIYHDESKNYHPPITIFEMWEKGYVVHRTFLMFPRRLHPPKLLMLTSKKDLEDPFIWESYTSFWVVIFIYALGWFNIASFLHRIKKQI